MSPAPRVVGILAGAGSLPREIAEHVRTGGGALHIVSIASEEDRDLSDFPLTRVGWAQIGGMLRALRRAGVTDLVIVGAVRRPDISSLKPDLGALLNLPAIFRILRSAGDDNLLSRIVRFFEEKGFNVVSPVAVMPSLTVREGSMGALRATANDMRDIAVGFEVVRALGPFDIGQAVVVADGRIEVIEGAENTDAMLRRLIERRASGHGAAAPYKDEPGAQRRGVLIKRPKPRQEMRVDLPTIGPDTVTRAVEAHLRGIAVLAGGAIALERPEMIRRADSAGIFVAGAADGTSGARATDAPPVAVPFTEVGNHKASAQQRADAQKGAAVLAALRPFYESAGAVVDRGHVLAVECGEGADGLIARASRLRQWGRRARGHRSAVAVIAVSPADTVGGIIDAAAAANLAGVALVSVTAESVEPHAKDAARHGLFVLAGNGEAADNGHRGVAP